MQSKARIQSHPIHPILVTFPIGLWNAGFIADLLGVYLGRNLLWAAGFYALLGGIAGALLAAVAGTMDLFGSVPPKSSARSRGLMHAGINIIALLVFVTAAWLRGSAEVRPAMPALLLGGLGVALIGVSGWLGGTLVFRNQIGVDHRYAGAGRWREVTLERFDQAVCRESELKQGQMLLVHAGGRRIAVGKCPDGIAAFQDRCTHKGGPLSDGALIGCTVQCPWHGSNFDAHTGKVQSGPAKKPIETYEAEVRGGKVYISPVESRRRAA